MRTTDFSLAPPLGRAEAMFVSASPCRTPAAWVRHLLGHRSLTARLRRAAGYRGHRIFWRPPTTLGTIGWFASVEDLERFARTGAHPGLRQWVDSRTDATGTTRVYAAEVAGYTNGVWRAEGNVMAHIERFTPVGRETERPPVRREARGRPEPER